MTGMNSKNFRNLALFFLLVLLSILIIYFQAKSVQEKKTGIIENICIAVLTPIENFSSSVGQECRDFFYAVFHYRKITRQINLMERQSSLLEKENILLKEAEVENSELKEILSLSLKLGKIKGGMAAFVISRDADLWLEKVKINKGYEEGIKENAVVINSAGLIGKIARVFKHSSEIKLLTAMDMAVPARIHKKNIQGIVYGMGQGSLVMKYIDSGADIRAGDIVITSGCGEVFPKGEKIGNVKAILSTEKDLFKSISIEPFVNFNSLNFVWILNDAK